MNRLLKKNQILKKKEQFHLLKNLMNQLFLIKQLKNNKQFLMKMIIKLLLMKIIINNQNIKH